MTTQGRQDQAAATLYADCWTDESHERARAGQNLTLSSLTTRPRLSQAARLRRGKRIIIAHPPRIKIIIVFPPKALSMIPSRPCLRRGSLPRAGPPEPDLGPPSLFKPLGLLCCGFCSSALCALRSCGPTRRRRRRRLHGIQRQVLACWPAGRAVLARAAVQQANTSLQISFFRAFASCFRAPGAMRAAWAWYQSQLAAKPVRTQIVTSGILWAVGDVVAQRVSSSIEKRRAAIEQNENHWSRRTTKPFLDWKKVAVSSGFGIGFVGPLGHFWYEGLEHVVKHRLKLRPNSLAFIGTKLAADALLFGPVHLVAFFTYSGLAAGKPLDVVKKDVARDFVPAFCTEGAVWPVVQVINFRFIPVQHQLLYVNFFCLLDSAFLSWFKYQEDAPWKRKLTAIVTGSTKE